MTTTEIRPSAQKRKDIARLRRKFINLGGLPSQFRALRYRTVIGWNDQGDIIDRLGVAVRAQPGGRVSREAQAEIAKQLSLGRTVLVVGADETSRDRAAWTVMALAIAWAPTSCVAVAV